MKKILAVLVLTSLGFSCQTGSSQKEVADANPAADGFNLESSDEQAIAIADQVMSAMGGRQAWDETRYISWNFFGARDHHWDKHTGNVRIEMPRQEITIIMNIHSKEGQAKKGETVYSKADSLDFYLDIGLNWWINDSYWLTMPFKLKDSGVTLKYVGEDSIQGGGSADVLQLTFEEIGKTPDNKYLVYVDKKDQLVKQWAFFSKAENEEPNFVAPWDNYQQHGKILLSGSRIGERKISNIAVLDEVNEPLFTEF